MNHLYLGIVAFGVTLLLATLVLGSKDHGHAHGHDSDGGFLGWAPIKSIRFWVFFCAFGGGVGLALSELGQSDVVSGLSAVGFGWASGAVAVLVIRRLGNHSASSEAGVGDIIGATGTVILPVGPRREGKVRVEVKGRTEDFLATVVEDGDELAAGARVLVVSGGEQGSLVVAKDTV